MSRRRNLALVKAGERKHRFGRHDRLVIDGQSFRADAKEKDMHLLQPMTGEHVAETYRVVKSDSEINALLKADRIRIEVGYYSKVLSLIRVRQDDSDLSDLSDDQLRTVAWKVEWCVRFHNAQADLKAAWRPRKTLPDFGRFVEENKDSMDRWYLRTFDERRRPGRQLPGEERKQFDWPSAPTLKMWVIGYEMAGCMKSAFRPRYSNCGNREQLHPVAAEAVARHSKKFASRAQPKMVDIFDDVEEELESYNTGRPKHEHVRVSVNAVRRRIRQLHPILVDAGRYGTDYALRKYTPVGRGLRVVPFERVEMDDWDVDLQTLLAETREWKTLTPAQKKLVPRGRMTVTAAIECYTRCIVGFNVTINAPSSATSKACLRTVMSDKSGLAEFGGAESSWPMHLRPDVLVTDGGPAFRTEFHEAASQAGVDRVIPEKDPRMRGTIESFFKRFKRVCRYFAGQTFANVVERGDYPAEEVASVTVGQFHRAVVRYVVDSYHHSAHSGLEGGTPFAAWERACAEEGGVPPCPPERQLAIACGIPAKPRPITQHGVTVAGNSFNSLQLGQLRGLVGQRAVRVVVEQEDAGRVWVLIPEKMRGLLPGVPKEEAWIAAPNPDLAGKLWLDVLRGRQEVRRLVRAEQEAGRPFRIEAHREFLRLAEQTRRDARIPPDEITERMFEMMEKAIGRKAVAALSEVQHAETEVEADDFGELVAKAPVRGAIAPDHRQPAAALPSPEARKTPLGGAMNDIGDDE